MTDTVSEQGSCSAGACAIPATESCSNPRVSIVDIVVLVAILIGMVYGIGRYGFYEPHEGHFGGVGYQMAMSGDWITPNLNGAPYLNKPPLFYWMIATSYSIFGISEWAARLPQALIGFAGVLVAWRWARELFGARAGRCAAGVLAVSAGWYLFSHQLIIDELLSVLYFASLFVIWRISQNPSCKTNWFWFYVLIGLSILAKGLVGPVFAIIVLFIYVWIKKDKGVLCKGRPLMGTLIVSVLVLPWLVMIELRNPGFLKYVIVNEHWNRVFDKRDPPDYEIVKKGVFEYLLISIIWLAPWAMFLPQIASYSAKNASRFSGIEARKADAISVLIIGALLPTLLFVPVPSRLIYYSLPTLPPFAILVAGWWSVMSGSCYNRGRFFAAGTLIVVGVAAVAAGQIVVPYLRPIPELAVAPQTLESIPGFALTIGIGMLLCGCLVLMKRPGMAMMALCGCLLFGEAYNTSGFAAFDRVRSSKRLVQAILPKAGTDTIWISEGSLEIGAAGGMSFNLGLDGAGKPRHVLVMSDGPKRRPPSFPGAKPEYLIDKKRLAEIWFSNKPALYVTDFQRTDPEDFPAFPPGELHEVQFDKVDLPAGIRRVFVNEAARKRFGL